MRSDLWEDSTAVDLNATTMNAPRIGGATGWPGGAANRTVRALTAGAANRSE